MSELAKLFSRCSECKCHATEAEVVYTMPNKQPIGWDGIPERGYYPPQVPAYKEERLCMKCAAK